MGVRGESPADSGVARAKVALCDDDALVLRILESSLRVSPQVNVVFATTEPEVALAYDGAVDLWLVDVRMPGIGGLEVARRITSRNDAPKVILITSGAEVSPKDIAFSGVSGFLFKDATLPRYVAAIQAALAGFHVTSPEVSRSYFGASLGRPEIDGLELEPRDARLAALLLTGMSYAEIGEELDLSESGVKKRVSALMRQVGVRSRPALMAGLHAAGIRPPLR